MTVPSDLKVVLKWHGCTLSTYKNHQLNLTGGQGGHASSDHGVQDNSLSGQFFNFVDSNIFCIAVAMCDLVHKVEKLFQI